MANTILIENVGGRDDLKKIVSEAISETLNNQKKPVNYITRAEACKKFHLSLPTIDKNIRNKTLVSVRIGGRVLIIDND